MIYVHQVGVHQIQEFQIKLRKKLILKKRKQILISVLLFQAGYVTVSPQMGDAFLFLKYYFLMPVYLIVNIVLIR